MYETLIYTNSRGESIMLSPLSATHCNVSNDVTGLSDVSNTLFTSSSMSQPGETYIGQKYGPRDININGTINTTNKDRVLLIRRQMQKTLNPELSATLTYVYGDMVRVIDCKAENTPIFRKKKVLTTFSITLACPNPFWREQSEEKIDIASWIAALEFELEIPEDTGIEFGYREPSVITNVYNYGDVETDMKVVFYAGGTLTNPIILNVLTGEFIRINTSMLPGDSIIVKTKYGEKGAELVRGDTTSNYFRFVDVDSTFMQLAIGDNLFRYDAESGSEMLEVSVYHSSKYLGV